MFVEETMGQIREKLALGVDDVVLMGWEKRKKMKVLVSFFRNARVGVSAFSCVIASRKTCRIDNMIRLQSLRRSLYYY